MVDTYTRALVFVGALTVGLAQIAQAQAQQTPPSQQPSAQQQEQQSPPPAAAAAKETVTSADVTDQEIEQFAKSYQDVQKIQKDSQAAQDEQAKKDANNKMAEAVQSHGMKVERFNTIARSLDSDATLKQRIQQKLQELSQAAQ